MQNAKVKMQNAKGKSVQVAERSRSRRVVGGGNQGLGESKIKDKSKKTKVEELCDEIPLRRGENK
jgi:hypothetical protein